MWAWDLSLALQESMKNGFLEGKLQFHTNKGGKMKYFVEVGRLESGDLWYAVTHISGKVFCRCKDMIIAKMVCSVLNCPHKHTKYLYALCLVGNGALNSDFLQKRVLKKVTKKFLKEMLNKVLLEFEK